MHRHAWYGTTELLPLNRTLWITVAIAHDGRQGHHGKYPPAGPKRIYLWRAPALDVRWHVLAHGGEGFNRLNALGGVDARLHVLIEQQPPEVGWEMPMGEVEAAIPQSAIEL